MWVGVVLVFLGSYGEWSMKVGRFFYCQLIYFCGRGVVGYKEG